MAIIAIGAGLAASVATALRAVHWSAVICNSNAETGHRPVACIFTCLSEFIQAANREAI